MKKQKVKRPGLYEIWFNDKVYIGESNDVIARIPRSSVLQGKKHGEVTKTVIAKDLPGLTRKERRAEEAKLMLSYGPDICLNTNFANELSQRQKDDIGKGRLGSTPPNKGKKGLQVAWNKGLKLK